MRTALHFPSQQLTSPSFQARVGLGAVGGKRGQAKEAGELVKGLETRMIGAQEQSFTVRRNHGAG